MSAAAVCSVEPRDRAAPLPEASFDELAFELKLLINREVRLNQGVEVYLARHPSENLALAYRDFVRSTERLADLYRVLQSLIPLEREVRALHAHQPRTE
ncbi:MAG: hypothetical protein AB7U62_20930 [Pseudolabrys sp.]